MAATRTPLRFPGGKTKLYHFINRIIEANGLQGCTYIEPFAGGSGLAIKLLLEGKVNNIVINDLDYAIYSIWDTIIYHPDDLCDFLEKVTLDISEWQKQREIYNNQQLYTSIEIGKASFYLNRTNISGVLKGGVIGGLAQEGNYKIDARFNRTDLIKKVREISNRHDDIKIYNWDAKDFIINILPNFENCFVYFDPPYVKKGHYLYKNSFAANDHRELFNVISACPQKWIVTYDYCELIKELYTDFESEILTINYSAGPTKSGDEIIIYGADIQKVSYLPDIL